MKIITGYMGKDEHGEDIKQINSVDDRFYNAGVFGEGCFVLDVGNKFRWIENESHNIEIESGDGVMDGVHFRIPKGQRDTAVIKTNKTDVNRIDLICATYTNDNGVEDVHISVITGTPSVSTNPPMPAYNDSSLIAGNNETKDFPLYKVYMKGNNIDSVEPMFEVATSLDVLNKALANETMLRINSYDSLNSKIDTEITNRVTELSKTNSAINTVNSRTTKNRTVYDDDFGYTKYSIAELCSAFNYIVSYLTAKNVLNTSERDAILNSVNIAKNNSVQIKKASEV